MEPYQRRKDKGIIYHDKNWFIPIVDGSDLTPPSDLASSISATVIIQPIMGRHRKDTDAVFSVLPKDVSLETCALFVTTLRESGFEGDIVLGLDNLEKLPQDIYEFLEYHSDAGLIIYEGIQYVKNDDDYGSGDKVKLKGLYGDVTTGEIYNDPRIPRPICIARYELFWTWSLNYDKQSNILLIDSKDTFFQKHAEVGIGVGAACSNRERGVLNLYEESKYAKINRIEHKGHMPDLYGSEIPAFLHNVNVLSPGSTHGNQAAIEAYLRAMVKQFDYTQCTLDQCDWAMHNYIHYYGILQGAPEIDDIHVHTYAHGAVNTVGRMAPLSAKGQVYENGIVYNLYGYEFGSPSWAVHQYDRDEELKQIIDEKTSDIISNLDYSESPMLVRSNNHKSSISMGDVTNARLSIKPTMGRHRPKKNAIFAIVDNVSFETLVLFVKSILRTDFDGDIVLSVSPRDEMPSGMMDFLEHYLHKGLVIYEGHIVPSTVEQDEDSSPLVTLKNIYATPNNNKKETVRVNDSRPARPLSLARYELFWVWTQKYHQSSRLLLVDAHDAYFQGDPFEGSECTDAWQLQFFKERNMYFAEIFEEDDGWYAFDKVLPDEEHENFKSGYYDYLEISERSVLNPNAIFGHQIAMEKLLRLVLKTMDETQCYEASCDWAVINVLFYYSNFGVTIDTILQSTNQGEGIVNTMGWSSFAVADKRGLFRDGAILNDDKSISPVVMNLSLYEEYAEILRNTMYDFLSEFDQELFREDIRSFIRSHP